MRVLFWNTNRGPGSRRLDWIAAQSWDVAILVEVSADGWRRLDSPEWHRSGSIESVHRGGSRFSVAVLTRGKAEFLRTVPEPEFPGREDLYRERAHAVAVAAHGREWTVLGLHMPNSVYKKAKDHSFKEACFEELDRWIRTTTSAPLVVGLDANRSDWAGSTSEIRPHSAIAQRFLRPGGTNLVDALLGGRELPQARPATYWTSSGAANYFDRILVSQDVTVSSCEIHPEVAQPGAERLSDHAAIIADLL